MKKSTIIAILIIVLVALVSISRFMAKDEIKNCEARGNTNAECQEMFR